MRPTTEYCRTQIIRLSGLPNFPAREGAAELIRTLAANAISEAHASRIVTDALDRSRWCATPNELREIAADTMGDYLPRMRAGCKRCEGTGFICAPYLVTWSRDRLHRTAEQIAPEQAANLRGRLTATQAIVSAARRCDCLEEACLAMPAIEPPKGRRTSGKMRAAGEVAEASALCG